MEMNILYEDKDIIVIDKPAGMAVQTKKLGQMDLQSQVRNYLAAASSDKKNIPYLGIVHRLDQPVAGVIVFAKNKKSADSLSKQFSGSESHKEYIALVSSTADSIASSAVLTDYLKKDVSASKSIISNENDKNAKKAVLSYETINSEKINDKNILTLKVLLQTGRFHQIRAQLSNAGMPIIGDKKYGSEVSHPRISRGAIGLCAAVLTIKHPSSGKELTFTTTALF